MLGFLVFKSNELRLYSLTTAFPHNPKNHQASHKPLEQWFSTWAVHGTAWEAVGNVNAGTSPPEVLVDLVWLRPGRQDFSLLP